MFFNSNSHNVLNKIASDFQNKDLASLENTSKYYSKDKKEQNIYLFSFLSHIFLKISPIINFTIKQLLSISAKMSNFNVILAHHSKKLNKTSEILKSSSEELLSSMEESSESLNNITMSISSNTDSLDTISSNANDIIRSLGKDDDLLDNISSVNSNIINNSNDMKNNMTSLDNVIKDINKIVEGINETANSTNLLALNASIEAARAGEHGKGFAVVATEIKALSQNTQKQLAFIQNFINEIKQASSKSNSSIENTLSSIDEMSTCINYMKESFDETKVSTKSIVNKIENISSNMEEITAVSEEINATFATVTDNAQNLVPIANNIFAYSEDTETISEDLDNVDNLLTKLGDNTSLLNKIDMFKLTNTDLISNINDAITAHKKWVDSIKYMAENMIVKPLQTDNHKCAFGHFYYALTPVDKEVLNVWKSVDEVHEKLHKEGDQVISAINANDKKSALAHSKIAEDCSYIVTEKFNNIKNLTENLSKNNKDVF